MEANEILEAVGAIEQYMPVVEKVVPLISKAGGELRPLLEALTDFSVDMQLRAIKRYKKAGMSDDQAILLVISAKGSIAEAFRSHNNKK